ADQLARQSRRLRRALSARLGEAGDGRLCDRPRPPRRRPDDDRGDDAPPRALAQLQGPRPRLRQIRAAGVSYLTFVQITSRPSRRRAKPVTAPLASRAKIFRERGWPGTNSTSRSSAFRACALPPVTMPVSPSGPRAIV